LKTINGKGNSSQLQDSLQGTINNMSKEYNNATPAKKKNNTPLTHLLTHLKSDF